MTMKRTLVAVVAAASSQVVLGFAPSMTPAPRSGVLALRAQVLCLGFSSI